MSLTKGAGFFQDSDSMLTNLKLWRLTVFYSAGSICTMSFQQPLYDALPGVVNVKRSSKLIKWAKNRIIFRTPYHDKERVAAVGDQSVTPAPRLITARRQNRRQHSHGRVERVRDIHVPRLPASVVTLPTDKRDRWLALNLTLRIPRAREQARYPGNFSRRCCQRDLLAFRALFSRLRRWANRHAGR